MTGDRASAAPAALPKSPQKPAGAGRWIRWPGVIAFAVVTVLLAAVWWLLVDGMNTHFRAPLVKAVKGGKLGGGAVLTLLGKEVLQRYRCMEQKALRAITSDVTRFEKLLARKRACTRLH